MFYSLTGKLVHMEPGVVAIECGGVAFKCFTSMNTQKNMPRIGETATVYTHLNVREDALDLYGFSTKSELNCYKMLTTISGVGPKAALAILSVVSPEQLTLAVMTQDDKTITMAQGVGKKLAQRIILELKDKLGASQLELNTAEFAGAGVLARGSKAAEATAALVGLGYSQTEAAAALKGIDIENLSIEDVIRRALRAAAQQ